MYKYRRNERSWGKKSHNKSILYENIIIKETKYLTKNNFLNYFLAEDEVKLTQVYSESKPELVAHFLVHEVFLSLFCFID